MIPPYIIRGEKKENEGFLKRNTNVIFVLMKCISHEVLL